MKKLYTDAEIVVESYSVCCSTKEGLQHINQLRRQGVKIHILNMGLIEDTSTERLIITNLFAFAEFRRAMIVERTQNGKVIAKTKAEFKKGQPKKFIKTQLKYAMYLLKGYSYVTIVQETGISKSTLIREIRIV